MKNIIIAIIFVIPMLASAQSNTSERRRNNQDTLGAYTKNRIVAKDTTEFIKGIIVNGPLKIVATNEIYAMGNSLTAAGLYQVRLAALLGGLWHINNRGNSGEATTEMRSRFAADVITPGDANTVVILAGVNDIRRYVSDAIYSVDSIKARLQYMYTLAHNAGIKVVAVTILPFKGYVSPTPSESWSTVKQSMLELVNDWILNDALNVDYTVDAYTLLEDSENPEQLFAEYDSGDHLHLSSAGYAYLGEIIHANATWTPSSFVPTVSVSGGNVQLNQSLRSSDSAKFRHLEVGSLGIGNVDATGRLSADGMVRAKGWYSAGTGMATEMGYVAGYGWVISYDRTGDSLCPLRMWGNPILIDGPAITKDVTVGTGGLDNYITFYGNSGSNGWAGRIYSKNSDGALYFQHRNNSATYLNAMKIVGHETRFFGSANVDSMVRAKGWYSTGDGHAVEFGVTSGSGWVSSYDRTADVAMPLQLTGSSIYLNAGVTSTGNYYTTGSSFAISPSTQSAYVRQFTTDAPGHGLWRNWETVTNNTEGGDIEWRVGASQGANPSATVMHLSRDGNLQLAGLTASQILETDASKVLISSAKKTGYNLDLGASAGTVAEGNHAHTEYAAAAHNHDAGEIINIPADSTGLPTGTMWFDPATGLIHRKY
jgi:lysophospholipase L1-like esterase